MVSLSLVRSRSETSSNYLVEKESCIKCFDSWPESDQVSEPLPFKFKTEVTRAYFAGGICGTIITAHVSLSTWSHKLISTTHAPA
jgi:hypothetical protein